MGTQPDRYVADLGEIDGTQEAITAACSSVAIALLPSSLAASEYEAHPGA